MLLTWTCPNFCRLVKSEVAFGGYSSFVLEKRKRNLCLKECHSTNIIIIFFLVLATLIYNLSQAITSYDSLLI